MRFDLAKERKGGGAAGGPLPGRGRGGSGRVESVEGDVCADVVERGGDDCLELGHVEGVAVSGRRHVLSELIRVLSFFSLSTHPSYSISTPFWRSSFPLIGDLPPSHSAHPTTLFILLCPRLSARLDPSICALFCGFYSSRSRCFVPYASNPSHGILPKTAKCLDLNSSHR